MGEVGTEDYPILYALDGGGALRFIEDVDNGEACGCTCPSCSQPLVAKNGGSKVMHHFAHKRGTCKWSVENVVARLAAQAIEKSGRMAFPRLTYHDHDLDDRVEISVARTLRVRSVRCEDASGRGAPEVVLTCSSKTSDKEFALIMPLVHAITDAQQARLEDTFPGVVVIDLAKDLRRVRRGLGRHHDRAELIMRYQDLDFIASLLLDTGCDIKYWLCNQVAEERERKSLEAYESRQAREAARRREAEERRKREEAERQERERRDAEKARLKNEQRAKQVVDRIQEITLIDRDGRRVRELTTIKDALGRRDFQVIDESGRRWIECEECGRMGTEEQFWTFGGPGRMSLGSCYACRKKH